VVKRDGRGDAFDSLRTWPFWLLFFSLVVFAGQGISHLVAAAEARTLLGGVFQGVLGLVFLFGSLIYGPVVLRNWQDRRVKRMDQDGASPSADGAGDVSGREKT
jgi:hypothetical protein